jgi:hypothetical protein
MRNRLLPSDSTKASKALLCFLFTFLDHPGSPLGTWDCLKF